MTCKTCGAEMIRKSSLRLLLIGVAMMASISIGLIVPYFWAPGVILFLIGSYLVVWGTLGKGLWCRHCKKFWRRWRVQCSHCSTRGPRRTGL